jgi:branched-chain amino acid transport system substrate-binding protein
MVKRNIAAVGLFAVAIVAWLADSTPVSAASSSTPGVTATTIRVGIPYVDLASLTAVGVDINWGSVPDAYNAIIKNLNAHGGINGRRIVPDIVPVNPTGNTAATTVCTKLTEDDNVFAVVGPLQATCYLQHGTPVIASLYAPGSTTGAAQDFTLAPPPAAFDKVQMSVFAKHGVFTHKKVAIFGGVEGDAAEATSVKGILAKLHVAVVSTAIDSATQGDLVASNAQVTAIAQRFETEGVNEVVAVGDGSAVWPQGLSAIQSTYNPAWIATNESDLSGQVGGDNNPTYLKNVSTSSPLTPPAEIWSNAGTQQCVKLVRKAYPSDHINAYSPTLPESEITFMGVELACTDMALFADIAKAAGKDLTVARFTRAGYNLKDAIIPGTATPVSFAVNRPYALGPVYAVHYDAATKSLVFASASSSP